MRLRYWKAAHGLQVASVAVAFSLGFPSAARTQEQSTPAPAQAAPPTNGLADASRLVADALAKLKAKQVVIFDFYSPNDPSWDRIGRQLAADVRTRVDAAPHKFKQMPYSNIEQWMDRDGFWQSDLSIADVAAYVIRGEEVDAFVTGSLTPAASQSAVNVRLFVYNAKKAGSPTMVTTSIPFAPELKAMLAAPMPKLGDAPDWQNTSPNQAGKSNAYTSPRCLYCPQAVYTKVAADNKFEGVITLITVVETNGKLGPIAITKSVPYGLDATAIAAVRKWRLEPARGLDGEPAAVRQTIEVQFHLY